MQPVKSDQPILSVKLTDVIELVSQGIFEIIRYAKGTCVSIYPLKLLKVLNTSPEYRKPNILSVIKHILEELTKYNIAKKLQRSNKTVYIIDNESPIWTMVKNNDYYALKALITEIVMNGE